MGLSHKELITNYFFIPLWKERSLEVIETFFLPNAAIQTTFSSGEGPEVFKKSVIDIFAAFPSFQITIKDICQIENELFYKWEAKGLHEGSIMGIPRTCTIMHFKGIVNARIQNGLISHYQEFSNIPQVLRNSYEHFCLKPKAHLYMELRKLTEYPLTRREVECLGWWIQGCSIKETAKEMGGLSARTVQTYRENIKNKFNVYSFQKIVGLIQNQGIMPLFLEKHSPTSANESTFS